MKTRNFFEKIIWEKFELFRFQWKGGGSPDEILKNLFKTMLLLELILGCFFNCCLTNWSEWSKVFFVRFRVKTSFFENGVLAVP